MTLQTLAAASQIATPFVILLLSAVGWQIRRKLERRTALEDKLRDDRIEAYRKLLQPFIVLLSPTRHLPDKGAARQAEALETLLSVEYRDASMRMALAADDATVRAFNEMMQWTFSMAKAPQDAAAEKLILHFGALLLAIRKSMGNEATALSRSEMLEWFITDARALSAR